MLLRNSYSQTVKVTMGTVELPLFGKENSNSKVFGTMCRKQIMINPTQWQQEFVIANWLIRFKSLRLLFSKIHLLISRKIKLKFQAAFVTVMNFGFKGGWIYNLAIKSSVFGYLATNTITLLSSAKSETMKTAKACNRNWLMLRSFLDPFIDTEKCQ